MNIYTGTYDEKNWHLVFKNGLPFDPARSLKLANHSPDGLAFGYHGSGAAQLALAILQEETGDEIALTYYQKFKDRVISQLPATVGSGWTLNSADVQAFLVRATQTDTYG